MQRGRLPDEGAAQHVNRNLLLVAVLVAAALVWWMSHPGRGESGIERETMAALEVARDAGWPDGTGRPVGWASGTATTTDADSEESAQQFRQYVDDKYGALFRDVEAARRAELSASLREREQLVAQINTAKQGDHAAEKAQLPSLLARKDEIDRKIGTLLPAGELARFEALKDSDIERFQVDDMAAGIAHVAPLTEANRQALLATKLAYRERFRRVLEDSRLLSGELTAAERRLAHAEVSRALKQSQEGYLQEVRQYLYDDEQFRLISNYETTEYNDELAKLRRIAGLD